MIEDFVSMVALKLHGGPFADGDEYDMALARQVTDGKEEFWFVVYGTNEGKPVQFDFNEMGRAGLEDIRAAIDLILESPNACLCLFRREPEIGTRRMLGARTLSPER